VGVILYEAEALCVALLVGLYGLVAVGVIDEDDVAVSVSHVSFAVNIPAPPLSPVVHAPKDVYGQDSSLF
jgi:hypothetical protein